MNFFNLVNDSLMATEKTRIDYTSLLTKRETEIMHHVYQGYTNKQIADKLFISEETVKKHLKNIFCKLDASNRINALSKLGLMK